MFRNAFRKRCWKHRQYQDFIAQVKDRQVRILFLVFQRDESPIVESSDSSSGNGFIGGEKASLDRAERSTVKGKECARVRGEVDIQDVQEVWELAER